MNDTSSVCTKDSEVKAHLLDECDPDDCYKTMMTERTELIKARRESEENLIKTVIQLSAALIALICGFISQSNYIIDVSLIPLLGIIILLLVLGLCFGLAEHLCASKAYQQQQQLVELFYSKQIFEFTEPKINRWVRRCQFSAFVFFVSSLVFLSVFAFFQAKERSVVKGKVPAPTTTVTSTTTPPTITSKTGAGWRQDLREQHSNPISGASNAATPAAEKVN